MAGELGDAASAAVDLLRIVAYLEGKIGNYHLDSAVSL